MIEIEINKDISKHEAKLIGSFTTRQTICMVIAVLVFIGIRKIVPTMFPDDIRNFLCLIVITPILAVGWIKPYGLHFEKFVATVFVTNVLAPKIRKYKTKNMFDIENVNLTTLQPNETEDETETSEIATAISEKSKHSKKFYKYPIKHSKNKPLKKTKKSMNPELQAYK